MEKLQLKVPELEVNPQEPWADDKLERESCARNLTQILVLKNTPLTIALNGEWGSGKTFLLKRWQQQLQNEGYGVIYFNSWEDDCLSDPLIALLGQLWLILGCKKYLSEIDENVPFIKANFDAFKAIDWKPILENIAKSLTGVDVAVLREMDKTSEYELLGKYIQGNQARATLKAAIGQFAATIAQSSGKPLVFIVDELDRCRPTFAVETLERIKHFFDIKNIIFVLGIDRQQLGKSVGSVYGNIDIENYLHRFIDIDFKIPVVSASTFCDWQMECGPLSFIRERYANDFELQQFWSKFARNLENLIVDHKFSLREIEHIFMVWRLVLNADHYSLESASLLAALIVLKIGNPSLYSAYVDNTIEAKEVIDYLIPKDTTMELDSAVVLACFIYQTYLPLDEFNDTPTQREIANLFEALIKQNYPLKSPICAECLKRAFNQQTVDEALLRRIHSLTRRRVVNRNTLRSLLQGIDLDFAKSN